MGFIEYHKLYSEIFHSLCNFFNPLITSLRLLGLCSLRILGYQKNHMLPIAISSAQPRLQGTRLCRGVSGANYGNWLLAKDVGSYQRRAPEALDSAERFASRAIGAADVPSAASLRHASVPPASGLFAAPLGGLSVV